MWLWGKKKNYESFDLWSWRDRFAVRGAVFGSGCGHLCLCQRGAAGNSAAKQMKALFKRAKIPYQQVKDMHAWQLCHLAMVVPIADAYYETDDPANAGADQTVMAHTARALRDNFRALARNGVHLSPAKMQMFRFLPLFLLRLALKITFQSRFGDVFMYRHAMKAPDEMRQLHEQFYVYLSNIQNRSGGAL